MNIDKEVLSKLYLEERKSSYEIANILGCSSWTILRKLQEFNIPRRTYKENTNPNPKGNKRLWSVTSEHSRQALSRTMAGVYIPRFVLGKWTQPSLKTNCEVCGKSISIKGDRRNLAHHYCSKACAGKGITLGISRNTKYDRGDYWQEVSCLNCQTKFQRRKGEIARYPTSFCCVKCNGEWKSKNITGDKVYNWKGGYDPYYGENWTYQRRKARERDNHTCQKCGKTKDQLGRNLDVDHKIPFEAFNGDWKTANQLSNLISLCSSDHSTKTNWQTQYGKLTVEEWEPLVKEYYL